MVEEVVYRMAQCRIQFAVFPVEVSSSFRNPYGSCTLYLVDFLKDIVQITIFTKLNNIFQTEWISISYFMQQICITGS